MKVTIYESRPPEVTVREWRALLKSGLAMIGEHWHTHFLPLHFEPSARYRYKYRPRTPEWNKRKKQLAQRGRVRRGGESDLVASGVLEDAMTQFASIRAFQKKATLKMHGPRYIAMKPRESNQPHKALEITTILQSEARVLDKKLDDHITQGLQQVHAPRITVI